MNISQEELKKLIKYEPESGRFIWIINASTRVRAGDVAGYVRKKDGYLVVRINGYGYSAHRLAWFYVNGVWPGIIDHKDRNPLNNAIANLREATTSQNGMNTGPSKLNTSGYRGVTWNKAVGKWQAQARVNGRSHYLGVFDVALEASAAYEGFCRNHHGQFFAGNLGESA